LVDIEAAGQPTVPELPAPRIWQGVWVHSLRAPFVIGLLFTVALLFGSPFDVYVAGTIAIYGLAAAGQGWLMGKAGQVSLGGGALLAVGAYAAALLSTVHGGDVFPLPLVGAAVAGGIVGAIVAVPGLRFRGVYLLLATLALLYIVRFVGERLQQVPKYLAGVTVQLGPGASVMSRGRPAAVTSVVILLAGLVVIERLYRSQVGREWAAVKENEIASAAMGIRVRRRKTQAFIGSSVITGLAGGLFAYYIGLASYTTFDLNLTLQIVVMVFVGGAMAASGPVIGAAIVIIMPYVLNDTVGSVVGGTWYHENGPFVEQILYGLALVFILLYARRGLAGMQTVARPLLARLMVRARARPAKKEPVEPTGPAPALLAGPTPAPPASVAEKEPVEPTGPAPALLAGPTPAPPASVALSVSALSVRYIGAGFAVQDVSFEVGEGQILGILGRNGAGKSTLLKAIGGFPRGARVEVTGRASLSGSELAGRSPEQCAAAGVVLVPEQGKVFPTLTVWEHFALVGVRSAEVKKMLRAIGFDMLERRLDTHAAALSGGERQFLALGVAVLRSPRLLLVDEMSLGLAPIAVAGVAAALCRIRDTIGCTVILVEQNARVAASIADEIAVLEGGKITWQGSPAELPADQLETAYFGSGVMVAERSGTPEALS